MSQCEVCFDHYPVYHLARKQGLNFDHFICPDCIQEGVATTERDAVEQMEKEFAEHFNEVIDEAVEPFEDYRAKPLDNAVLYASLKMGMRIKEGYELARQLLLI